MSDRGAPNNATSTTLVAAAAAAAAIGSIAFFQKKRAPQYLRAASSVKATSASSSATNGCQGHCHSHSLDYELFPIDYQMHGEHREKLIQRMRKKLQEKHQKSSGKNSPAKDKDGNKSVALPRAGVLLHGGREVDKYDTDTQYAFRQESFFQYLFGVKEPDCAGMIDLATKQSVLFIPRLSDEWELWCGERKSTNWFRQWYQVDQVFFMDEMEEVLRKNFEMETLYVLKGVNTDSGLTTVTTSDFDGIDKFKVDEDTLYNELVECRVLKSDRELDLLRFINGISSKAHVQVMKTIRPGHMEFHAESTFLHYCYSHCGARLHAYTCICGSGHNGSALHYGHAGAPNDKKLEDGDMMLNDMGAELHCYASDITCTFPVNGKFTSDQKMVYEGVLKAHDAVIDAIKPGVSYIDMHLLSHRVLTQHFLEHGLFQNGTVDELMDHEISSFFYPHGLGHLMGLDVHDVGGYPVGGPKRSEKKILSKLRCVRTLEPGVVLTVEPGCYFIEAQIKELLSSPETAKFVNQEMLSRFRGSGGVRIESNIIVTADGAENMTQVPRTVEDIERVMSHHT